MFCPKLFWTLVTLSVEYEMYKSVMFEYEMYKKPSPSLPYPKQCCWLCCRLVNNIISPYISPQYWKGSSRGGNLICTFNRGQNLLRKFTDMYNFGSIRMNLCLLFTITPLPPGQCWI